MVGTADAPGACRMSCGDCKVKGADGADKSKSCAWWADEGYCKTSSE